KGAVAEREARVDPQEAEVVDVELRLRAGRRRNRQRPLGPELRACAGNDRLRVRPARTGDGDVSDCANKTAGERLDFAATLTGDGQIVSHGPPRTGSRDDYRPRADRIGRAAGRRIVAQDGVERGAEPR